MPILTATLEDGKTIRYNDKMIGQGMMKEVYFSEDGKTAVYFYINRDAGKDQQPGRYSIYSHVRSPAPDSTSGGACRAGDDKGRGDVSTNPTWSRG